VRIPICVMRILVCRGNMCTWQMMFKHVYVIDVFCVHCAGALVGVLLGVSLRAIGVSGQSVELLGFPGELMLRLLKMLVLPLIAGSMTAGT
jgi:Na+/H+-dicarboxylate symporter